MMRIPALAALVLCLAGCFAFDNPFDTAPKVTFQITVQGGSYAGTYVWTPGDNAFEGAVGSTRYYVYVDSNYYWCLASELNQTHLLGSLASSYSPYAALPPTVGSSWYPPGALSSVDDSAGGVCRTEVAPDSPAIVGTILQFTFKASNTGNSATCQWQRSSSPSGSNPIPLASGSTYAVTSSDKFMWILAIITPTDSTGTIVGTPVTSPPVYVSG